MMNTAFTAGHVETVHAYTNDQNLIDNYHKAERRGRSAALKHGDHGNRCGESRGQSAAPARG